MNSRRTFRLRTPRIKTKVHAGGAMLPGVQRGENIFATLLFIFRTLLKS